MKKVAVVYHIIAQYRLPIFKELANSNEFEYNFFSDEKSINDIELAGSSLQENNSNWIKINNHWLKEKILFQSGFFKHISKYDTFIFLGNPNFVSTWLYSFYIKFFLKKRVFFWTHGFVKNESNLKWSIRNIFYSLSDGLLLYGHFAKTKLIAKGLNPEKLHVIYNSLDSKKQSKLRSKFNLVNILEERKKYFNDASLKTLVFVGRLTKQKKIEQLIEALKNLVENNKNTNLLIIGDGESRNNLEQKVKEYNLIDNVFFYGKCYDEIKLSKLMSICDLCVSPGEIGLTAMTSLVYGVPILTHSDFYNQMPEFEAIIQDFNGGFFSVNNIKDLSFQIDTLLNLDVFTDINVRRSNCYKVIDEKYNPMNQLSIINNIIKGEESL